MFKLTLIVWCVYIVCGDEVENVILPQLLIKIKDIQSHQDNQCLTKVVEKCATTNLMDETTMSWNDRCCFEAIRTKCMTNEAGSCKAAVEWVVLATQQNPIICSRGGATWGDCGFRYDAIAGSVVGCVIVVVILGFVAFRLIQYRRQHIRSLKSYGLDRL